MLDDNGNQDGQDAHANQEHEVHHYNIHRKKVFCKFNT